MNIPGEIRHQMLQDSRIWSAKIMMALAVVFCITYLPFQMWLVVVRFVGVNTHSPFMVYALHFAKQMLFANGCFNPIAMFAVSNTFRKLLVRHVKYSAENVVYSTRL